MVSLWVYCELTCDSGHNHLPLTRSPTQPAAGLPRSAAPGTRARRSTSGAGRIWRFQRSCLGSTPAPRPRLDARRPDRVRPRGTTHLLAQMTAAFAAGGRPSAGITGEEMGRRGSVHPRHVPAAQTGRQARVRDRCLDRAQPIHVLATAGVAPVRHRAPHVAILPAETADPRGRPGPGRRPQAPNPRPGDRSRSESASSTRPGLVVSAAARSSCRPRGRAARLVEAFAQLLPGLTAALGRDEAGAPGPQREVLDAVG